MGEGRDGGKFYFKKFIFFCAELKNLYRFADMKTTRVYNWSWRTSSADAVRQAII
jgi:hypothetical protein